MASYVLIIHIGLAIISLISIFTLLFKHSSGRLVKFNISMAALTTASGVALCFSGVSLTRVCGSLSVYLALSFVVLYKPYLASKINQHSAL
ncbi:hypothetical protein KA529_02180 [Candidatus Saccharibacteria bacterium]|nr:hypothetical protein [Candidatus Saccharibacteria bacterium]